MRRKLEKCGYLAGTTIVVVVLLSLAALCWWILPRLVHDADIIWAIIAFSLIAAMFGALVMALRILHWDRFEDR